MSWEIGNSVVFDVEVYPNFFLVSFMDVESGDIWHTAKSEYHKLDVAGILQAYARFKLIGFNSLGYDELVIDQVLKGIDPYEASKLIINKALVRYNADIKYKIPNHIDVQDVCPLRGSLKLYGARLHCHTIRSLPYEPDKHLTLEEMNDVIAYCGNDLKVTALVYNNLQEQIKLRELMSETYSVDLRSKSDQAVAETVLIKKVEEENGTWVKKVIEPPSSVEYKVPPFISFKNPLINEFLTKLESHKFKIESDGSKKGCLVKPAILEKTFTLAKNTFKLGIGGIHTTEKQVSYRAGDYKIFDFDVTSYYPAIKLKLGIYPPQCGPAQIRVFKNITEERVSAKKNNLSAVSNALKIVLNGSIGKENSFYSKLYNPQGFLAIVITGQLSILMLAEMFHEVGITVISANTDGITVKIENERQEIDCNRIVEQWQRSTSFSLEKNEYVLYCARDVNSYVAVLANGKVKSKGEFANPWEDENSIFRFHKNPDSQICKEALQLFLAKRIPYEETIRNCKDMRKFTIVCNAKGGAHKDGVSLGSVLRFYWSRSSPGPIRYITSGNSIPLSDGARPMQDLLTDVPPDLDYQRYIKVVDQYLIDIGYNFKKQMSLDDLLN